MTDHLPECPMLEGCHYWDEVASEAVIDDEHRGNTDDYCPRCGAKCICSLLRACEQRVTDEIWGAIREGSQYKSGFEGGLDAAREAVERVSTLFEPLGPALAAIDALRGQNE